MDKKEYMKNYSSSEPAKRARQRWNKKNKKYMNERLKAQRRTKEGKIKYLINTKKYWSKKNGVAFDLFPDDIEWPDVCPVLGITLNYAANMNERYSAPSLDRVNPSIGYVKDNVRVISYRANQIKSDGSAKEHRLIAKYIDENTLTEEYAEEN